MGNDVGEMMNDCALCGFEGMMPFVKDRQKTFCKCPECFCEFEEDRLEERRARRDAEEKLAAWTEAAAGWRGGAR